MPDLSTLGLTEDMFPTVDWDAPEGGKTPPPIYPGSYKLLFCMPESHDDWFDVVERTIVEGQPKRKFLEITWQPKVICDAQGRPLANDDGTQIQLGPQRSNTFMSAKMKIHAVAELLRSMGVQNIDLKTQLDDTLKQLDGKGVIESAEVIWRAYFKSTDTTISTHPRGKKSKELLWPRDAQGNPEIMAVNPNTGEKAYGYAEVVRVHAPQSTEAAK